MRNHRKLGITKVEIVVVILVIGILLVIFMPAPRLAREAARRMQCSNYIRQVSLACANYESAHKRLPAGWGGPAQLVATTHFPIYIADESKTLKLAPIGRWSAQVAILPYLEDDVIYRQVTKGFSNTSTGVEYKGSMAPWNMDNGGFTPWRTELPVLRCPSDPGRVDPVLARFPEGGGRTNYAFCYGDTGVNGTNGQHQQANRGVFQGRYCRRLDDIKDGVSNTVMLGEIGTSPSKTLARGQGKIRIHGGVLTQLPAIEVSPQSCRLSVRGDKYTQANEANVEHWRGMRWADGAMAYSGFNTILQPNSPSCTGSNNEWEWGYYSLTSYHGSGADVAFVDGSVHYIANSIDTRGNPDRPAPIGNNGPRSDEPSPYGVWGAMGSIDGAEELNPEEL